MSNEFLTVGAELTKGLSPEDVASIDWAALAHMLGSSVLTGDFDIDSLSTTLDGGSVELAVYSPETAAPLVLASAESTAAADGVCEVDAIPGESVISERCDGAIQALQEANVENPREVAIKLGMFEPSSDPHALDSAALPEGTRFVQYDDGSVRVFDPSGKQIAYMDCDGNVVQKYEGPMMNPDPCDVCHDSEEENAAQGYEEVKTPIEVVDPTPGPRVATLATAVNCEDGQCIAAWRNFLIFNSEEEARAFFASDAGQQVLAQMRETGQMGSCVYITDGVGSVQTIEIESRNGMPVTKNGAFVLDDEVKTTTFDNGGKRHMSEKAFEERFLKADGHPFDREKDGVPQDTKERGIIVEGSAQNLVFNPETGQYEYEPITEAQKRIVYAAIENSGLTVEQFKDIMGEPVPAVFSEPIPDDVTPRQLDKIIENRAQALLEKFGDRGLTPEGARNLARYLSVYPIPEGLNLQQAVSAMANANVQQVRLAQGI